MSACQACDGTQARCHKRNPELDDYQVYLFTSDEPSRLAPRKGIDAIHDACDRQVGRLRILGILCFSGEEEVRVLESEGE